MSPILRLALTCSAGYAHLVTGNKRCDSLFKAVLTREPQYGYGHFRYAEYLYSQALGNPDQRHTYANSVCKNFGQALSKLASTRLLRGWHEDRAFYNCPNLALDMEQFFALGPDTKRQWYLLGQGLGRKGNYFWRRNQGVVIAHLRDRHAPLAYYDGLASGLAKAAIAKGGAEVLHAYTSDHPQDGIGWEAFIRYLDAQKNSLGPESVKSALIEASQKAN